MFGARVAATVWAAMIAVSACTDAGNLPAISTDTALAEACGALDEQTAVAEVVFDRLGPKDQEAVLEALGYGEIFCRPDYQASALSVTLISAQVAKLAEVLAPVVVP